MVSIKANEYFANIKINVSLCMLHRFYVIGYDYLKNSVQTILQLEMLWFSTKTNNIIWIG